MGTQRTSNKDIADKLDTLIELMTQQAQASVTNVTAEPVQNEGTVSIDAQYKQHMLDNKVQPFADKHGEEAVLYARRNTKGEVKLAYCLRAKWDNGLNDRGLIGAVATVSPQES